MSIILDDIIGCSTGTGDDFMSGNYKLMALSRQGLTFKSLFDFIEKSGFPLEDWAAWLRVDSSWLLQKRDEEEFLEPHQSERILEIHRLLQFGNSVLNNIDMVYKWFNHISIPLGSVTPKSLLDNTFGIDIVRAELGRIEHGVLA